MKPKRGGAKGVKLPRRRAHENAYEELPQKPTPEQLKDAAINVSLADLEDRVADVRDSWETDSLFEDALDDLSEESSSTSNSEFLLSRLWLSPVQNSTRDIFRIASTLLLWVLSAFQLFIIPLPAFQPRAHSSACQTMQLGALSSGTTTTHCNFANALSNRSPRRL